MSDMYSSSSFLIEKTFGNFLEVSYYLIFTEDTKPSSLLFQCKPWSIFTPHSFSIMPEAMWTNDYSLNVTFRFDKDDKLKCLNIFKSNNFLGFVVFLSILIGKI